MCGNCLNLSWKVSPFNAVMGPSCGRIVSNMHFTVYLHSYVYSSHSKCCVREHVRTYTVCAMVTLLLLLLAQMPVPGRWTRVGGTTTMSPVASSTLGRSSSSVRTCTHTQTPPLHSQHPFHTVCICVAPLSAPISPLCCFTPSTHLSLLFLPMDSTVPFILVLYPL